MSNQNNEVAVITKNTPSLVLAIISLVIGVLAGSTPGSETESVEIKVVKAFIDAINSQDIASLGKLMTEDHAFMDGTGGIPTGRNTTLSGWRQYYEMFPDYVVNIESIHQDGSIVAVFGSTSGTYNGKEGMKPENKVSGPAAWKVTVENRKVKIWKVYVDYTETQERITSSPTDSPGYTDKAYNTPDFLQSDPQGHFPNKGYTFCAPVAISNSLMWLDDHGFDKLVRNTGDRKADQIKLVKQLASEQYIDTVSGGGRGTTRIFTGVSKYISSRGYRYKRFEYQGIANPPKQYHTGVKIPQLDWIKGGILGYGSAWLKVAWYDHNPETDIYVRGMGHVVTVVGYGVDEGGNENPNIIIIHDPAIRSGRDFANDYVLVEKIDKGAMKTKKGKLLSSAKGFYKLTKGFHKPRSADCAIIEGAIVLEMK
jgi:ketosteroid isomerase-like protein